MTPLPPTRLTAHALLPWLLSCYRALLRLYPRQSRVLFAAEMYTVFAEALNGATAQGWHATIQLCWREVRDLPRLLLSEYGAVAHAWFSLRLQTADITHSDLPGVVPVGYGSLPHLVFMVAGRNPRLRRCFDLTVATVGLLLVAPLLLFLPILIKLDSSGPILYRQQRLGRAGRIYTLYKFRSMRVEPTPLAGVPRLSSPTADWRITRIGGLTRRWHLDEIPQIFNVFKGDMSIFGPRPPMPNP